MDGADRLSTHNNDEPWFVGKDVAEALGFKRTADALSAHVDDEDKNFVKVGEIPTLNVASPRGLYIINESGLYSLILSSKLMHQISASRLCYKKGVAFYHPI